MGLSLSTIEPPISSKHIDMKRLPFLVAALAVTFFSLTNTGCEQSTAPQNTATSTDEHGHDGEGHEDHESHEDQESHDDHDDHGPHGGQVIDLGRDHQYHAELKDNHDDESITVYLLNGEMEDHKIDATAISLTLVSGDDAQTFELITATKDGDEGSSFTIKDEAAFELIEAEGTEGKLRVEIDGKPYTGTFAHHEHDH